MMFRYNNISRSLRSGLMVVLCALTQISYAQEMVSTDKGERVVILEEFTGVKCSNCPDGHRISDDIKNKYPGRYAAINIHGTSLGAPAADFPDFRIPYGEALLVKMGIEGLPMGVINRTNFTGVGTMGLSREVWEKYAYQQMGKEPIVNIGAKVVVDYKTREMVCEIEAYYLEGSKDGKNALHVAILQNNVLAPQSGANAYIEMVVGKNYRHNHMLRELIFGLEGDTINSTNKGRLVKKTYNYTFPDSLYDVPFEIGNMDMVVFITESNGNTILNGAIPQIKIHNVENHPTILATKTAQVKSCDPVGAISAHVYNKGVARIDILDCQADINGNAVNLKWQAGEVGPTGKKEHYIEAGDSAWCTFSYFEAKEGEEINIRYKITKVNGENVSQNVQESELVGSGVFLKKVAHSANASRLKLEFNIDQYGSEVSWRILDSKGEEIHYRGYNTDLDIPGVQTFKEEVRIPYADCFALEVFDAGKDGFNTQYGQGSYKVYDQDGVLLTEGDGKFADLDYRVINIQSVANTVNKGFGNMEAKVYPNPAFKSTTIEYNINTPSDVKISVYNSQGLKVYERKLGDISVGLHQTEIQMDKWEIGLYFIRIESDRATVNKTIKVQKI